MGGNYTAANQDVVLAPESLENVEWNVLLGGVQTITIKTSGAERKYVT